MSIGVPAKPVRECLFPFQDVAALDPVRWRVVIRNLARHVHAERDELAAVPADVARRLARRGRADHLLELVHVAVAIESVRRPRKRRQPLERPHVSDVDADVHEPASVPARRAERGDGRAGSLEERASAFAIEARARARVQVDAAQRDQRRHRCVDVERRRPVERRGTALPRTRIASSGRRRRTRSGNGRGSDDDRTHERI